jgi:SAM-dependent methyltransferase
MRTRGGEGRGVRAALRADELRGDCGPPGAMCRMLDFRLRVICAPTRSLIRSSLIQISPPDARRRRLLAASAAWAGAPMAAGGMSAFAQTQGLKLDVPFAPTNFTLIDTMLRIANVTAKDYVIDLGSGDGRINIAAARDWGASGIGFELDPALVRESIELAKIARVSDRVQFTEQNLFDSDIGKATVVTLYLGQKVNLRVRPKLLAELRPGTRIVSHDFDLGEWRPDLHIRLREYGSNVFFWWVPARIAGTWSARLELPGAGVRAHEIDIRQNFQEIESEVRADGARVGLRDVRLAGEGLTFIMMEEVKKQFTFRRFFGRIARDGNTIEGYFRTETEGQRSEAPFRMTRVRASEPGPAGAWTFVRGG